MAEQNPEHSLDRYGTCVHCGAIMAALGEETKGQAPCASEISCIGVEMMGTRHNAQHSYGAHRA
jgi:hypothetical protein